MSVEKEPVYADSFDIGVENLSDLEAMPPSKQMDYLIRVVEATQADAADFFLGGGRDILEGVINSDRFSPLSKIIAKAGADWDHYHYAPSPELADLGYTSIEEPMNLFATRPGDELFEGMSKEELMIKLEEVNRRLKDCRPNRPIETGSEEDMLLRQISSEKGDIIIALEKLYFQENQSRLHREFPSLPEGEQLVKIASDAAATVEFLSEWDDWDEDWIFFGVEFGLIADRDGHTLSVSDPDEENFFHLDKETLTYLVAIHSSKMAKMETEKKLNFRLTDIPLKAQTHLLKFMSEANNSRFDRLCDTLHSIDSFELRQKLLENFVATDFGEDFGDSLLDIVNSEHISGEQLEEILDKIESCRTSIDKITGLYKDFDDGKFANEYSRAANERLTDAITVFREIANNGEAKAAPGWLGEVKFGYDEAIEALGYETKSLEIISGTLEDASTGKEGAFAERVLTPDARHGRSLYNFYSPDHGYVLLYTRAEGSGVFDPAYEYGKFTGANAGVEASISLITDPVNPFRLPSPYRPDRNKTKNTHYYDHLTMDKVSAIRLDREGRAPGMAADDPERSPVNPVGMVSVDLAATGDREDTPSGKIARLISVGNELRAKASDNDTSLNHNARWFDQDKYGAELGFHRLVSHVDSMVSEWCHECPPKRGEGFTGLMRKRGNIGKKAAGF